MELHPDFRDLLAELVRYGVSFAVIGGYAVAVHGRPRATKDLDILVSASGDNLERLALSLESFGAPAHLVASARSLGPTEILYLGVPPVRVDLLRSADGVETEAVLARAIAVELGDLRVPVISLDDLIANKLAAGRPQDLADAALLERSRQR